MLKKKKITFGGKQDIRDILDNVFYDRFHLTSLLVSNFSEVWWRL